MIDKVKQKLSAFWKSETNRLAVGVILLFFLLNSLHVLSTQWIDSIIQRFLISISVSFLGLGYYLVYGQDEEGYWSIFRPILGIWFYVSVLAYFVHLTLNLNNPEVSLQTFDINFWSSPFHWLAVMIASIGSLIWVAYPQVDLTILDRFPGMNRTLFSSQILTTLVIWNNSTKNAIVRSFYFNENLSLGQLIWQFAFAYMIISVVSWLLIKSLYKSKQLFTFYRIFNFSFHLALLANYSIQAGVATKEAVVNRYLFSGAFTFQVGLLLLLFLVLFLLVNRTVLTGLAIITLVASFSWGNGIKFIHRAEPILPSDLIWLKQIKLLFGFLDKGYLSLYILSVIGVSISYWLLRKKIKDERIALTIKQRVSSLAVIGIVFAGVGFDLGRGGAARLPFVSALNNTVNIDYMGNAVNARMKSLSYVWIKQLVTPVMGRPQGYNRQAMADIETKYVKLAQEKNKERQFSIEDATVIYILSESFSDPSRLPGISISREPISYIKSLFNETTSGLMQSDGYGGGTANMEFQALTGLPMYNMSSSVSTINTEVGVHMPYIPSISQQIASENRYAIHLESGNNYSRNSIYHQLGFGTFIGRFDVDTVVTDFDRVGVHPGDASSYQYVLNNLDEKQSQFFSVMTMQNHMPWSIGDPEDIVATGEGFNEEENAALTSYARLLNHTDQATHDFLMELEKIQRPILVVFYGDHLPSLYSKETFSEFPELQYQTDFFIWSNDKSLKKERYPLLNSSDLTAAMLETSQARLTPYQALLAEVLEKASVNREESDRDPIVSYDLKLVEYDLISGQGYLTKSKTFFEIGE